MGPLAQPVYTKYVHATHNRAHVSGGADEFRSRVVSPWPSRRRPGGSCLAIDRRQNDRWLRNESIHSLVPIPRKFDILAQTADDDRASSADTPVVVLFES